jgi:cyclohexyl-isocyanide hydratase
MPEIRMIPDDTHLLIGSLIFEGMDQIDLTGPFEALSRVRLIPDAAPGLDVLHVPGGFGQEALMEDQEVIAWIKKQAAGSRYVLSVCTGALLCGERACLRDAALQRIGHPFTCCHFSARSQ